MARYPSRSYGRRRNRSRSRIYIISALLVLVVVAVFIYGSRLRGRRQRETFVPAEEVEAAAETVGVEEVAVVPEREPEVEAQPEAEPEPSSAEVVPVQPAASNPEVARLIDEAMALMDANPSGIIKARDMLNEALPMAMGERQREFVKKQLSWLADKWLFSRSVFPQDRLCSAYRVKRGDQLGTIGRQFKVPYEILKEINNIARAEALRAGEPIKVIQGPFNARVYRSSFTMDLYLQNTFVRSFSVGLGKPGMETPTGLWVVKPAGKLIKPVWTDPITGKTYHPEDRDYPLGSRWIGLAGVEGEAKGRTGFAIHGTKKPEEIGTAGSQGCIRLHNGDVVLVYKLLMPGVSQVEVVE